MIYASKGDSLRQCGKQKVNEVESMQVKINVSPLVLQTKNSTWSVSGNILHCLVRLVGFGVLGVWYFSEVLSQNWTNAFSIIY